MTNEKIKTKESSIDLMMTGQVMKREIKKKGYTVRVTTEPSHQPISVF